ncbi:hypothetical protein A0257_22865 (plasmid) [Hymenobacter psoromatis]|nr:hypothetical protein A0257_22865 [Hymenobacter psoromatis]
MHCLPRHLAWLLLLLNWPGLVLAQSKPYRTENVILVTLDGMRWQEIFGGAKERRLGRAAGQRVAPEARSTAEQRRRALLPFLWDTVAAQGQLYGNRVSGNRVNVANYQHFSYPGYQELLTGFPNACILSNAPVDNHYPSVLTSLNQAPAYQGRVAAFASWSVLGHILNAPCCDFPVNAGWQPAAGPGLTAHEQQLNAYLRTCPRPFVHVRTDTLTFAYAFDYLQRRQPRVLYIGFGETDELAHEGRYADYLAAAHAADHCLAQLWAYVQATPRYRNKTTLLITTDHGRGQGPLWRQHGLWVPGSGQTWLAVLGPDTPPTGEQRGRGQLYAKQVAQTLAHLLAVPYQGARPTGPVVEGLFLDYPLLDYPLARGR